MCHKPFLVGSQRAWRVLGLWTCSTAIQQLLTRFSWIRISPTRTHFSVTNTLLSKPTNKRCNVFELRYVYNQDTTTRGMSFRLFSPPSCDLLQISGTVLDWSIISKKNWVWPDYICEELWRSTRGTRSWCVTSAWWVDSDNLGSG